MSAMLLHMLLASNRNAPTCDVALWGTSFMTYQQGRQAKVYAHTYVHFHTQSGPLMNPCVSEGNKG